ncbi:MAG TPA: class I SAM-dependent methyltransferase [Burkholderiales bacterium]|jgi:protein-L-isoaspartate O-methyltransferase|nr:class I SAM-dependent methyltransferase [Burkholderiales bacterium]
MKHWIVLMALASPAWADEAEWRPPFITTPPEVVERMLQLAGTRAGDLVVDLGSGDGRIVIAAAQKFGARGLGIELDAALVEKSRENAKRMKLEERVRFVEGDVLRADISGASVVTVYLLPALMVQLQSRFLEELAPGTRIVSHSFTMAGWPPDRSEMVKLSARHPGQGDESRLYLWIVPADVRGVWRGGGLTLRIEQNFQQIDVEGATKARISGREIAWQRGGVEFKGRVEGDRIIGPFELARQR